VTSSENPIDVHL